MPGPSVLFVKLSSLGDVVHHFPAVTDLARHLPQARVAWAVEEAYADLVRLHPAVSDAIPVGLRSLRRSPLHPSRWRQLAATRRAVRGEGWDYVIDTQGLVKSATIARWAGTPRFGPDRASAREKVAARFYDVRLRVPRQLHAVERNRLLVAGVFGYALDEPARYGVEAPLVELEWLSPGPCLVFLHAASRATKRWPEDRWIELGRLAAERGWRVVLPGGTAEERATATRMAAAIPEAIAAPAMTLTQAAALLARAGAVCGVDTGLTHLAAALGRPTVGLYAATRPELTGLHATNATNLGGAGRMPTVDEVAQALAARLESP
jgi:heptosyltransferase-1